jgi:hypothetical protein
MNPVVPRERLARVLGMLGSEHDGEALAAARAAEMIRRQMGATWSELLTEPPPPSKPHRPTYRASPARTWRDTCAELVKHKGCRNRWEVGFVSRLPDSRVLSAKQRRILDEIALRVLGSSE